MRRRTATARRSLSLLVWEGAYANVFIVLTGGAFLTGMAILLGANDLVLGVLAAAPFLMQSAQLLSPYVFTIPESNKDRVASTLAASRMVWLAVVPLLLFSGGWRLYVLLGVVVLSSLLTMVSTPAWLSWMANAVPARLRGRFFSRRNAAVAVTTLLGTVLGSLLLDWTREMKAEALGFAAIVGVASVGALLAWRAMRKLPNGRGRTVGHDPARPDLLAPVKDKSFRRLLGVFAVWNGAIGLSAAFFAPHMLLNLRMSFFLIGLYTCATALVAVISSRAWGRLLDRFGSRAVLNLCAAGIGLTPLIWLFPTRTFLWILIPEAVYSGLLWAGFNLAAFTLPLDRSPRENRTIYLSVFAAVTGFAFFLGSLAAGFGAESLQNWSLSLAGFTFVNYHVLFVCSALVRIMAAVLIKSFREPADVRLPVVVQLMGYAVLKRMSLGRQILPFAVEAVSSNHESNTTEQRK